MMLWPKGLNFAFESSPALGEYKDREASEGQDNTQTPVAGLAQ